MKLITTAFATLLLICALIIQASGKEEPPDNAKKSFLNGISQLKEQTDTIFNEKTLPALKPIKDVLITSEFKRAYGTNELEGVVRVRIRVTKDSGHMKIFWLSLRDEKWIVTRWAMEPWERDQPPKVSITNEETKIFVEKVQSCFNLP